MTPLTAPNAQGVMVGSSHAVCGLEAWTTVFCNVLNVLIIQYNHIIVVQSVFTGSVSIGIHVIGNFT